VSYPSAVRTRPLSELDDIVFGGFTELIVNKDENVKILVHP